MVVREESSQAEIDRILHSDTFRNSDVLRRLLRFLADKTISGSADQLKEYTIGIDALGKPSSYDPRQDSVVRIQVARLRQKLTEYYRVEGKDDPIVVELPNGRFKLIFEPRVIEKAPELPLPLPVPVLRHFRWKTVAIACAAGFVVL